MKVQEFRVVFLLGRQKGNYFITSIKHIVAKSLFTMNDNALFIRDEFITGLNDFCGVAISSILEENFLWGIVGGWGDVILYISYDIFLQINNYMGKDW